MQGLAQAIIADINPNEVELDKQGKLLKSYLAYDGFTAPFIEAYDHWITTLLPAKVMRTQLRVGDGTLFFSSVTPDYPRMGINEARDRNLTYNAELYADVAYRPPIVAGQPIPETQRLGQISLGKIPVLIGSSLSKVYRQTEEDLLEMGEDPKDPNGYVINKGTERLVLIQEKLRMNRIFVFIGDKKGGKKTQAKGALVARMTCSTVSGSTLVLLKEGKIKDVDLSLHFMGKNPEGEQNAVNVISAMIMLGTYIDEQTRTVDPAQMRSNINNIVETVLQFSKNDPRWKRKVWIALQPSILRAAQLSQRGDHFELLADKMFSKDSPYFKETPQAKRDRIIRGFLDELFPQVDPNAHLAARKKYEMLSMMLARFLEVLCGLRKADDRDNWGNKRLETAAIAIERLFNTVFDLSMKLTQKSIDDKKYNKDNALKGFSHQNVITDNFTSSFNSNNWGVKGAYYKENITDILKRDNIIATYSHLRRVNTPTSRKAKQPTIRLVAMSSLGYICPVETPEGENLGIVKNLTTGCYISVERDELPIRQEILPYIQDDQDATHMSKCILNGRFLGWCDGVELRKFALLKRRQGLFPRDTCIVLDNDDVLHLYCDSARPLRPLLIVDDGEMPLIGPDGVLTAEEQVAIKRAPGRLVIDELDLWDADIPTLIRRGCVEYVDAFEQDGIKLAYDLNNLNSIRGSLEYNANELRKAQENVAKIQRGEPVHVQIIDETGVTKESPDLLTLNQANERVREVNDLIAGLRKKRPYTHCELDAQSILSISSSTIPSPQNDQGPRLVYQCNRFDTPVVMADGTVRIMQDLKNGDEVITIDPSTLQQSVTKVTNHFLVPSGTTGKKVLKLKTLNGRSIVATEDHKFLTQRGWVELKDIDTATDLVSIWPSVKPLPHTTEHNLILGFKEFEERLAQIGIKESLIEKHSEDLEALGQLGLLPLYSDSPQLPIIARIAGFCLADGYISVKENGGASNGYCFGTKYDAELYQRDMMSLGFPEHKISECEDTFIDKETGREATHHVWNVRASPSFASFLLALGIMYGKRTLKPSNPVPEWIMKGSPLVKREFLAGFQGGDGCKLRWNKIKNRVKGCNWIIAWTSQQKCEQHVQSLIDFMGQIQTLFVEFGLDMKELQIQPYPYSPDRMVVGVKMVDSGSNLLKYVDTIGYRYATTKSTVTAQVAEYLRYRDMKIAEVDKSKKEVLELFDGGMRKCDIRRKLGLRETTVDSYIRLRNAGWTKIPVGSLGMEEWATLTKASVNCVFMPVASITVEPHCIVGDFTTESPNHSFVAGDGFVTHNCTMAKQSLGIPGSNYQNRFDTTTKMLAFPTKPLFTPQIDAEIGLSELPVGQMAVIAIKTHKGANQEDSFNFNEAAIQRGFFRMIKYIVKKTTLKKTPEIEEMFEIPKFNPNDAERFANILKDGTPRVGAILRQNDCVIGKVVRIKSDNTKENASMYIGLSEEGIVDRVLKTTTDEGMLTIKVRIRQVRTPIVGDKFAPRHAQKGTIGILEKEHEMPFVKEGPNEGLVPSILINPHSIPSRMTIAMLIEIAQSRISTMTGRRLNATAFHSYSLDQVMATLRQFGFDQYSNEKMISGLTGKEITTEIFMGECYYQALRHHVKDKIQMRSRGAVNPTTHQPVGGRIRRGGLRFGEMERDSLISHGASALLRERLNDVSDAYKAVYCKTCGTIAITDVDNKVYKCRYCGPAATDFGIVVIPYAFKLLVHLLWGADYNLRLLLSSPPEEEEEEEGEAEL